MLIKRYVKRITVEEKSINKVHTIPIIPKINPIIKAGKGLILPEAIGRVDFFGCTASFSLSIISLII
jgi:hypothetical protein